VLLSVSQSKSRLIGKCAFRYHMDESRPSGFYEEGRPCPRDHFVPLERQRPEQLQERQLPPEEVPTYLRTGDPRRQVIVLD
jgi:hypothetical protein